MARNRPLPDALRGVPFTVEQARQLGVGRGRLAGADLHKPFHGIRSPLPPLSVRERCVAYRPKLSSRQVFSHITAAVLHGIPLQWGLDEVAPLHVTTVEGIAPKAQGVIGHSTGRRIVRDRAQGLPATDAVQTFFDLATMTPHAWLVVAGDALVGGTHPLCSAEQLTDALSRRPGERGSGQARRALERVRLGVDSPMETLLRLLLVDAGLPEPTVNRRYWAADGLYLGKVDLSYPQWRIAIEYEGAQHRTDPAQFGEDLRRRARFESAQWVVIRVEKSGLLEHSGEVVRVVRAQIAVQRHRLARGEIAPYPAAS